jgi:hypothetical protein
MYVGVVSGAIVLAAWLLYAARPAEEPTQQRHANAPSAPTSDVSGSSSSMLGVAQWPSILSATYWRFVVGDGQLGRRMEYQVNVTALEAAPGSGWSALSRSWGSA